MTECRQNGQMPYRVRNAGIGVAATGDRRQRQPVHLCRYTGRRRDSRVAGRVPTCTQIPVELHGGGEEAGRRTVQSICADAGAGSTRRGRIRDTATGRAGGECSMSLVGHGRHAPAG